MAKTVALPLDSVLEAVDELDMNAIDKKDRCAENGYRAAERSRCIISAASQAPTNEALV